ncbi:hypothetical protein [Chitinophaga flava]|uniref:hypothetical protein n=1 Tax=Chitinophaga flava TaxID=2259036 RepID=UPI0012939688|nr:hypothetical protein [Chitinophaga flava]
MWTTIFIIAIVLLILGILRQLIILSTTIQFLSKDPSLLQHKAKEEDEYLFIKGLY